MSIAQKLAKLETDISNAYTSIATKGGTIPQNKNTDNLASAIDSISGGRQANIFIQNEQPEGYNGIWIADNDYVNFPIVEVADKYSLVASSINIVRGVLKETLIVENFTYTFTAVYLTDSNNNILYDIPVYYGDGTQWLDITEKEFIDLFYNGIFKNISGFTHQNVYSQSYSSYSVDNNMNIYCEGRNDYGGTARVYSNEQINFTNYNKLKITMAQTGSSSNDSRIRVGINSTTSFPSSYLLDQRGAFKENVFEIDISSISGINYLIFNCSSSYNSSSRFVISKIELTV